MEQTAKILPLTSLIELYREIEDEIIQSGGEITPEIEARIADVSDSIGQKLDGYAGFIAYCKGQIDYLKGEADQYTCRARTLAATIEGMRDRMVYALQSTGETKIKTAKHSYSLRTSESWKIDDDLFSNRDLDELVGLDIAERTYKVNMSEAKKYFTESDERPEYMVVTQNTSINIR